MATIILKKSNTAGAVPLAGDLDIGEIAINTVDRKVYTIDGGSVIRRLDGAYVSTTAPSNPVQGDIWYDSTNNILKTHNGTGFVSAGYTSLEALEDTTITTVGADEFLVHNGTKWVNKTWAEADVQQASTTVSTARGAISVTDNGGDGSLTYSSATGVITYTGPSATEVQAHFSGGTGISLTGGAIAIDFTEFNTDSVVEGVSNLFFTNERVDDRVAALVVGGTNITSTYDDVLNTLTIAVDSTGGLDLSNNDTDDVAEGLSNLYFTNERVDDRVAALVVGGTNITSTYDDINGTLTIAVDNTGGLNLANNDTDDLTEGLTNLYYTDTRARAAISVTDNGGDGSLTYSSATGVITYTGPSATEVRAHFSGGTGVSITSGVVAIGQDVATTSDVTFNDVTLTGSLFGPASFVIDPAAYGDNTGTVTIKGDLIVDGTTTSVNSNTVNIGDNIIVLNSDETGIPSQNAGITVERGTSTNVSFLWNETLDAWDMDGYNLENVIIDGGTY